jgi:hypothetical protein
MKYFCCMLLLFPALAHAVDYGTLELTVTDRDTMQPTQCRMHLVNAQGKPVKVPGAIQHGDHAVFQDKILLKLPLGGYHFTMDQGTESLIRSGKFDIQRYAKDAHAVDLKRFANLADEGWWAGDLDVQRLPTELPLLMQTEGIHFLPNITWTNGKNTYNERIKAPEKPSEELNNHRLIESYAGLDLRGGTGVMFGNMREALPLAAANAKFPTLASTAAAAKQVGGTTHAVTPFARELPLLVAAGKLDSIMVLNRHLLREGSVDNEAGGKARDKAMYSGVQGNGRWGLEIYYKLLETGIRLPLTAGSGSGANTNPVGYNRVYAWIDGEMTFDKWWEAVKLGRTFVTNGPLLRVSVDGEHAGHVFQSDPGKSLDFQTELTISTREKIDYLEIVKDGLVVHDVRLEAFKAAGGKLPVVNFDASGWFLVRAVTNEQKTLRYATTSPFYVEYDYKPRISKKAVQFFLDWVETELASLEKEATTPEQTQVRDQWRAAKAFWQGRLAKATVE